MLLLDNAMRDASNPSNVTYPSSFLPSPAYLRRRDPNNTSVRGSEVEALWDEGGVSGTSGWLSRSFVRDATRPKNVNASGTGADVAFKHRQLVRLWCG